MDFKKFAKLKQWFHKDLDDIIAFHFHLSNIILLLMNDYREGEFYCFCNKVKKRCTLCKMSSAFSQDKMKAEELLERFQHNHDELKKLADEMWPYFEETFILDFFSLGLFNKEYHWSSRNRDNFSYSYLTLQEIIDNNEYKRKLNGDNRYFKFTYG